MKSNRVEPLCTQIFGQGFGLLNSHSSAIRATEEQKRGGLTFCNVTYTMVAPRCFLRNENKSSYLASGFSTAWASNWRL
jgi:hypothetical protein